MNIETVDLTPRIGTELKTDAATLASASTAAGSANFWSSAACWSCAAGS